MRLGADALGRDVWSRFLHGGLSVLWMSPAATLIGVVAGVAVGLVAAYSRNWLDDVLMRGSDVVLAFPGLLLAIALAVFVIGVTLVKSYESAADVRLRAGDSVALAGYDFRLEDVTTVKGPNYVAARGHVTVTRGGKPVTTIEHGTRITSFAFRPDGKKLATAGPDGPGGTVKVWDVTDVKNPKVVSETDGANQIRGWVAKDRIAASDGFTAGVYDRGAKREQAMGLMHRHR